jgi:hypothetical protein
MDENIRCGTDPNLEKFDKFQLTPIQKNFIWQVLGVNCKDVATFYSHSSTRTTRFYSTFAKCRLESLDKVDGENMVFYLDIPYPCRGETMQMDRNYLKD